MDKNWGFHFFPWGPHRPAQRCQHPFGLESNLPPGSGLQDITHNPTPHLLCLLRKNFWVIILKTQNLLVGWEGRERLCSWNLRASGARGTLRSITSSKDRPGDPAGVTGSKGAIQSPDSLLSQDQVHLLFSISTALHIHFSAPFSRNTKGSHLFGGKMIHCLRRLIHYS